MTEDQAKCDLSFSERLAIELADMATLANCLPKFEAFLRTMPSFQESWLVRTELGYQDTAIDILWMSWLKGFEQLRVDLLEAAPEHKAQYIVQSEREGWRYADELEQERKKLAARVAYLEDQLVKESARTAAETLRANQMSLQHSMQAKLNSQARNELARLSVNLKA